MKVFLLGMMGSGKSYWMNRIARKLDVPRYDLDDLVEKVEDRTIKQIFEESGEEHFRKMESIVLKWFEDKDEYILATGGGTPCFSDNITWMNQQGLTIWIDEPIDVLLKRLLPEKEIRPLISKLNEKEIEYYLQEKRAERKIFYQQAKFVLTGNEINIDMLLSVIKKNTNA